MRDEDVREEGETSTPMPVVDQRPTTNDQPDSGIPTHEHLDAPTPASPLRNLLISLNTLILGAILVTFLTRYNHDSGTVWSSGPIRPSRSWEEYLIVNVTALLFLPFLMIFGLFRESAPAFGFATPIPERRTGRLAFFGYLGMLPVLWIVSRFPDFQNTYPLQYQASQEWGYLFYFEITYGFYLFCWEFFYRGFLTFGLQRRFGDATAILLQALAFGLMHWGKPMPEFISSFFGGAILGWLALRARSFLPGFALHWAIAATLDLLAIHTKPSGLF